MNDHTTKDLPKSARIGSARATREASMSQLTAAAVLITTVIFGPLGGLGVLAIDAALRRWQARQSQRSIADKPVRQVLTTIGVPHVHDRQEKR